MKQLYNQYDVYRNASRRRQRHFDIDDEDEYEGLGVHTKYEMVKKELTLQEKEKEDEMILEKEISNLNNHFRSAKVTDENDIDKQSLDTVDTESCHSNTIIKSFNNTLLNEDDENDSISFRRSFLSQNVSICDELIKLIIIGQRKVGKTLFIQQLSNEILPSYEYTPTSSLEITKTVKTICHQKVKIELWDTCDYIINSDIIKTYYKITNGFVIIIDKDTDMNFILNKLEIIQETIQKDVHYFIIFNDSSLNNKDAYFFNGDDFSEIENKLPVHIYKNIKRIMQTYLITFTIVNVKGCDFIKEKPFVNFINDLIRIKSISKFKSVSF